VKALIRGAAIEKELNRFKADGLAAIDALLNDGRAMPENERIASLVRGFEFGAKLRATLYDELLDTDATTKVVGLMNKIAETLDNIGSGRVALATLLDHANAAVRATAGAYLLSKELIPERVVPVLREMMKKIRAAAPDGNDG